MISKIANYLKYNYFWDGDGIEKMSRRDFENSHISAQDTL